MSQRAVVVTLCLTFTLMFTAGIEGADTLTGMIDIGNGKLYYELAGSGPTVVLLHGGMLDCRMWDAQFEALAKDYRVLRYDARGHGRSDPLDGDYSHYEDLAGLMDALEIERAVIVGLSLGGRTAIDFALEHPEKVQALVPVAPGLSGWEFADPVLKEHWKGLRQAAQDNDLDAYVEWFQKSWTDGPKRQPEDVDPEVREKVRAMARATVEKPGTRGKYIEAGAVDRLPEIKAPTLVIVGEIDMQDILGISDRLVGEIAGAKKAVIPNVAHMVNMEAPEEFTQRLLTFLKSL
jgi:3-oxoadipate enol-lactonase